MESGSGSWAVVVVRGREEFLGGDSSVSSMRSSVRVEDIFGGDDWDSKRL